MLNGVDVSSWNDKPDFYKIPGDFVIVKLTQGTKYVSPVAADQIKSAQDAGKLIGVYHYAGGGTWKDEATHFLEQAKPYIGKAILVLDWESGENPNFKNPGYARDFLAYVFAKTRVRPFLYMSQSTCASFAKIRGIEEYPLWVAQVSSVNYERTGYSNTPFKKGSVSPWTSETIRQYCWAGHLPGASGNFDLNLAYMTKTQWEKYAATVEEAKKMSATAAKPTYKVGNYTLHDISYGDKGEEVRFLQQLLNAAGYDCGTADGVCGDNTLKALAEYQADQHRTTCGKGTWQELLK